MSARHCVLDGRQRSKRAVLAKLGRDLGCDRPIRNVDALYDVLRRDLPGPIAIVWKLTPATQEALGADLARITATLREVAAERADFELRIED